MNLYLLSQIENEGYDTFDSMVVCAESEEDAAKIHPYGYSWKEDSIGWASSPSNVKVKYIGVATEDIISGSIICTSFNAG